jgi:hypothetical protein
MANCLGNQKRDLNPPLNSRACVQIIAVLQSFKDRPRNESCAFPIDYGEAIG